MKLIVEYVEDALKFEQLAALEQRPELKAALQKQAAAYRKLAEDRAKKMSLPPPGKSDEAASVGGLIISSTSTLMACFEIGVAWFARSSRVSALVPLLSPVRVAAHLSQLVDMAVGGCCWRRLRRAGIFSGLVMARPALLTPLVASRAVLRRIDRYTVPSF